MSSAPLNSARDLRDALADVIRRYVQHLDFDAPTQLVTVRIEASGPGLNVVYAEHADKPTSLTVSINNVLETRGQVPEPEPAPEPRGRFGRG